METKSSSDSTKSLFDEGVALYENKQFSEAKEKLETAYAAAPTAETIMYNLALVYLELHKYKDAWQLVNKIRQVDCRDLIAELRKNGQDELDEFKSNPDAIKKDFENVFLRLGRDLISFDEFVDVLSFGRHIVYLMPGKSKQPTNGLEVFFELLLAPFLMIMGIISLLLLPIIWLYYLFLLIAGKGFSSGQFIALTSNEVIVMNNVRKKFFEVSLGLDPKEIGVIPLESVTKLSGAFQSFVFGRLKLGLSDGRQVILIEDNSFSWRKSFRGRLNYIESMSKLRKAILQFVG